MTNSRRKVSVYIPAYNVESYLEACIDGVQKQTYPIEEIIVVNDGSGDASEEIARRMGVRVIDHGINKGLSTARNTAFIEIDTPFIASLDADCVPAPNWLEILMDEFDSPAVAGVAGKLIEQNTRKIPDLWRLQHMQQNWGDNRIISPTLLFGNNNVFRRDAILSVGNYPTSAKYRTNAEDFFISQRLREHGWIIRYNPAALVSHYRTDTVGSMYRTNWRWFILSKGNMDSFTRIMWKFKDNVHWGIRYMMKDLRRRNWRLIPMSLGYAFALTIYDLKNYLSRH